jgi:hypothetical protein
MCTATYKAPEGESKVVEWQGITFLDGVVTEIPDNAFDLVKGNHLFEVVDTRAGSAQAQAGGSHQPPPQHQAPQHQSQHDDDKKRR